jgi:hypothetical protein
LPKFKELKSKDEWIDEWQTETIKVVVFSTVNKKSYLTKKFETLLAKYVKSKVGRQGKITDSTALYPLSNYYNVNHLKNGLAVHDAVMANRLLPKREQVPLWKIGENLKTVAFHAQPPKNFLPQDYFAILPTDDSLTRARKRLAYSKAVSDRRIESKKVANARHNVMTATVSRLFNEAQAIVENTALGRFPDKKRSRK